MPCNLCQQYSLVEESDVVRNDLVLPGQPGQNQYEYYPVESDVVRYEDVLPGGYEDEQYTYWADQSYVVKYNDNLPGACDSGDAFWWFLGGALAGGLAAFAVVTVTGEKTVKGASKKAFSGIKKMLG